MRPEKSRGWHAMYSSVLGGIVLDPKLFVLPIDDHMAHRGHAVFDTCNVAAGKAYGLDFHLDRLLRSAEIARVPHQYSKEQLRKIVLRTIAASDRRDGVFVRYWLSAGRGDFSVTPADCTAATFYVIVHDYLEKALDGVGEVVVGVPLKPPLLATIKSTNYLLNALTAMEAQDRGGTLGIQADPDGFVTEGSIGNIAIVDENGVLRTRPFDVILAGTTIKRALVLAPRLLQTGMLEGFEIAPFTVEEMERACEVICLGGGGLQPILSVNGKPVGDGKVGPVTTALHDLLLKDMATEYLDEIPYSKYEKARRVLVRELEAQRGPFGNGNSVNSKGSGGDGDSGSGGGSGGGGARNGNRRPAKSLAGVSTAGLLAAATVAVITAWIGLRQSR
ncbi:unnamed protein product [Phaeothamnion confervicola]